jgi:hypothetical protein
MQSVHRIIRDSLMVMRLYDEPCNDTVERLYVEVIRDGLL